MIPLLCGWKKMKHEELYEEGTSDLCLDYEAHMDYEGIPLVNLVITEDNSSSGSEDSRRAILFALAASNGELEHMVPKSRAALQQNSRKSGSSSGQSWKGNVKMFRAYRIQTVMPWKSNSKGCVVPFYIYFVCTFILFTV